MIVPRQRGTGTNSTEAVKTIQTMRFVNQSRLADRGHGMRPTESHHRWDNYPRFEYALAKRQASPLFVAGCFI